MPPPPVVTGSGPWPPSVALLLGQTPSATSTWTPSDPPASPQRHPALKGHRCPLHRVFPSRLPFPSPRIMHDPPSPPCPLVRVRPSESPVPRWISSHRRCLSPFPVSPASECFMIESVCPSRSPFLPSAVGLDTGHRGAPKRRHCETPSPHQTRAPPSRRPTPSVSSWPPHLARACRPLDVGAPPASSTVGAPPMSASPHVRTRRGDHASRVNPTW
jgi:hypothetical protein